MAEPESVSDFVPNHAGHLRCAEHRSGAVVRRDDDVRRDDPSILIRRALRGADLQSARRGESVDPHHVNVGRRRVEDEIEAQWKRAVLPFVERVACELLESRIEAPDRASGLHPHAQRALGAVGPPNELAFEIVEHHRHVGVVRGGDPRTDVIEVSLRSGCSTRRQHAGGDIGLAGVGCYRGRDVADRRGCGPQRDLKSHEQREGRDDDDEQNFSATNAS